MKSYLKGMLGAFTTIIIAALLLPLYSDYRSRSETASWLENIAATQKAITSNILLVGSVTNSGASITPPNLSPQSLKLTKVLDNGTIVLRGGRDGQVVVLSPSLLNGKVTWVCIGGPAKAMPPSCRSS